MKNCIKCTVNVRLSYWQIKRGIKCKKDMEKKIVKKKMLYYMGVSKQLILIYLIQSLKMPSIKYILLILIQLVIILSKIRSLTEQKWISAYVTKHSLWIVKWKADPDVKNDNDIILYAVQTIYFHKTSIR